ncbi:MAG: phosphatidylglycerol lysyltransferase domain-containing protein [Melioribacteraceae bacterium]
MIPKFPNFKKIEINDKKYIDQFVANQKPYSDFNFTSLWVWDTDNERRFSELNNNLVIYFTDYVSGEPFLSFFGSNKVVETAQELIIFAKKNNIQTTLRLIPEEVVSDLKKSDLFSVVEDQNNFDYIFSTSQLSVFRGVKYKAKRRMVNKFSILYPNVVFKYEKSINFVLRKHIIDLLQKWTVKKESNQKIEDLDFENEKKALLKILQMENKNLLIFTCFLGDNLIGFEIDEILQHKYAIAHFSKVNTLYSGVNDFLNMKLSQYLNNIGIEFCNWEQDLGIENLRKSKMSYCPVNFFKKYEVSLTY